MTLLPVIFLLALILCSFPFLRRRTTDRCRLPPGPRNLPFVGSLHHLTGSLPHQTLRRLSNAHGPVLHIQLGEIPVVVVSSAAAAREVLKTHDVSFASRPSLTSVNRLSYGGQDLIFTPYGPFWRQMRRLCVSELLCPRRVAAFRSIREQEVLRLLHLLRPPIAVNPPPAVDLSKKLAELTSNITMSAVIGRPCMEKDLFLDVLEDVLVATSGFSAADLFPSLPIIGWLTGSRQRIDSIFLRMDPMLDGIVREHLNGRRKEQMEEDLLDVLLRMSEEFQLSLENIKSIIMVARRHRQP